MTETCNGGTDDAASTSPDYVDKSNILSRYGVDHVICSRWPASSHQRSAPPGRSETFASAVVRRPGGSAARVRTAVRAATRDELTAVGYGEPCARIATAPGCIGQLSTARRWSGLDNLVTEALVDAASAHITVKDGGDIVRDLRELLRAIAGYVSSPDVRAQIRSLVGDAARSTTIATVVDRVWFSRFHPAEVLIQQAIDRGDLPASTILASFFGPSTCLRVLLTDASHHGRVRPRHRRPRPDRRPLTPIASRCCVSCGLPSCCNSPLLWEVVMGSLKIHHLVAAHITRLTIGPNTLICHVVVVETPNDGLVLIDTGLGTADYADINSRLGRGFAQIYAKPEINSALAAIRQIEHLGLDPHDVRHIVQTHLDLDHVGGLSDFPWATVHVHATELQAATDRKTFRDRERYPPAFWAHGPHWHTYSTKGEPWFGFESVRGLVGLPEDIFFVPLPGHTMGHCGVVLDTTAGLVLAAGDAFYDRREVNRSVNAPPASSSSS